MSKTAVQMQRRWTTKMNNFLISVNRDQLSTLVLNIYDLLQWNPVKKSVEVKIYSILHFFCYEGRIRCSETEYLDTCQLCLVNLAPQLTYKAMVLVGPLYFITFYIKLW